MYTEEHGTGKSDHPSFSPLGMLAERAICFTSSLSLQLVYLRRC